MEFEAAKHAVNVRNVETRTYELGQGVGDLGMICGGTVRVLFRTDSFIEYRQDWQKPEAFLSWFLFFPVI